MVSDYWIGDDLLPLFRELVPDIVRIIEDFPKDCMRNSADCFGIFFENSKYRWNCTAIPVETADFCEGWEAGWRTPNGVRGTELELRERACDLNSFQDFKLFFSQLIYKIQTDLSRIKFLLRFEFEERADREILIR